MIFQPLLFLAAIDLFVAAVFAANQTCKTTPSDPTWPSHQEWSSLNASIGGALIKTVPVASSCYSNNPFNSTAACDEVQAGWSTPTFHAALPESIDYSLYANNSCLPPGTSGYTEQKGCSAGALSMYIVNATAAEQIATAMSWASSRNIRIVVKGTGHDMNGRSSGAFSMSIWTRHLRNIQFHPKWPSPGSTTDETADIVIAGSGNDWGTMNPTEEAVGKVMVGGEAASVGLGGFTQGGGHGPMSSHYGLAADQILQATIAVRGGGAGQYGVVTEYVMMVYPAPTSVVVGTLSMSVVGSDNVSIAAAWDAFAVNVQSIPDMMDAGLSGHQTSISHNIYGFNMTAASFSSLLSPVVEKMKAQGGNGTLSVSLSEPQVFDSYNSFFQTFLNDPSVTAVAGGGSMMSSRLLGRDQLTSNVTRSQMVSYLQRVLQSQFPTAGATMAIGMQGGKGTANVPESMRGALHLSWRTAYIHMIVLGSSIDPTADPKTTLESAARWINEVPEAIWEEWAPEMGSYMNEANPYNVNFKKAYYGESYDRLLEIKKKYDPTYSLFVLTGVGSDAWDYKLNTGRLCQVA
ncbi:FAD-binding domain-containing protein [Cadophora sp. DSE1049]|nr:FAD-binding domain-containing protein [Cadophora sp. DSE1049]